MLKTTKEIRIYGGVLVLIVAFFLVASFLTKGTYENENYLKVNAYFLNPVLNRLECEERMILRATNEEMIAELLLDVLYKEPNNKALSKTIPEFVKLQKGDLIENKYVLQLEFTTDGNTMTGEEELFFKSSLVHTMTELPAITDLHIYINDREMLRSDGEPVGLLNRDNVIINREITPFVSYVYRMLLYFADENYTGLLPEERVISVKSSPDQNIEKYVVEQLIAGPSRIEHYATVPPETKIRYVNTEDDICYVNLSNDAMTRYLSANSDAKLTIYSIVNSLTELEGINKVQFLVDSKKPELVKGGYDLSTPIERDESIIIVQDDNQP